MTQNSAIAAFQDKRERENQIHEQMITAILERKLVPGTKLSEEELADIFDVSRATVRKVLQKLAYEKVVVQLPNKGAYVAELSPGEAKEVLVARQVIELGIMKSVLENATEEDLKVLEDNLTAEKKSISEGNHGEWVALSGNFHLLLATISRNTTLENFLKELVSRTSLIHIQYQTSSGMDSNCSCDEHSEIIDAIRARDEKRAISLMTHHLDSIEKSLDLDGSSKNSNLFEIFGNNNK